MVLLERAARQPQEVAPQAAARPAYTITITEGNAIMIPPRRAYASIIAEAAERYRIDAALIASVMEAESAFNPFAVPCSRPTGQARSGS